MIYRVGITVLLLCFSFSGSEIWAASKSVAVTVSCIIAPSLTLSTSPDQSETPLAAPPAKAPERKELLLGSDGMNFMVRSNLPDKYTVSETLRNSGPDAIKLTTVTAL